MLTRFDPFREMLNIRRVMDRMFDRVLDIDTSWQPVSWDLALDVAETPDEFLVKASVPGINPDDLEITYTDNVLTIKGETKAEKDIKEEQYHLRERRYGSFSRSIALPSKVKAESIEANYDAGVLTLKLPKAEETKPKRISIQVPKMLEGKTKK
jgi:HSP20 family protein